MAQSKFPASTETIFNMAETITKQLLEIRINYIQEMYSRFIQDPDSNIRNHPIDFKNFIIFEIEKDLKKIKT